MGSTVNERRGMGEEKDPGFAYSYVGLLRAVYALTSLLSMIILLKDWPARRSSAGA